MLTNAGHILYVLYCCIRSRRDRSGFWCRDSDYFRDSVWFSNYHRRRINTEEKAKVVAAAWGTECIQFLAALAILHQDSLKKRIRIITDTLRNGCFEKLETIPNIKMDVLPKTFVQIILAAYWLMRHSRTSPPNQQRRHLPSLLYLFFFYMG